MHENLDELGRRQRRPPRVVMDVGLDDDRSGLARGEPERGRQIADARRGSTQLYLASNLLGCARAPRTRLAARQMTGSRERRRGTAELPSRFHMHMTQQLSTMCAGIIGRNDSAGNWCWHAATIRISACLAHARSSVGNLARSPRRSCKQGPSAPQRAALTGASSRCRRLLPKAAHRFERISCGSRSSGGCIEGLGRPS